MEWGPFFLALATFEFFYPELSSYELTVLLDLQVQSGHSHFHLKISSRFQAFQQCFTVLNFFGLQLRTM